MRIWIARECLCNDLANVDSIRQTIMIKQGKQIYKQEGRGTNKANLEGNFQSQKWTLQMISKMKQKKIVISKFA